MEYLGNDLGIDDKSSSSNSSNNSSDVESSSSDFMSQTSEECLVQMPEHDRFKKSSYQSTTLDSFVVKQPKTSSTTSPSTSKLIDQDHYTRVVKVWTDPIKAKDKERRRVAEQRQRAESKKSDTSVRTQRVLGKLVLAGGVQCEWNVVARRIAREHPNEYGEQHPAGAISRQALKYRIRHYLLESSAAGFVGRRRAIPEQVFTMTITTISANFERWGVGKY